LVVPPGGVPRRPEPDEFDKDPSDP
jgi:hypothetical protein